LLVGDDFDRAIPKILNKFADGLLHCLFMRLRRCGNGCIRGLPGQGAAIAAAKATIEIAKRTGRGARDIGNS
jgi:hypothetical protein